MIIAGEWKKKTLKIGDKLLFKTEKVEVVVKLSIFKT